MKLYHKIILFKFKQNCMCLWLSEILMPLVLYKYTKNTVTCTVIGKQDLQNNEQVYANMY